MFFHNRNRQIRRRAAEHIRQHDNALSLVDGVDFFNDFRTAFFHVVLRENGDRFDRFLLADDVFHRGFHLVRQISV